MRKTLLILYFILLVMGWSKGAFGNFPSVSDITNKKTLINSEGMQLIDPLVVNSSRGTLSFRITRLPAAREGELYHNNGRTLVTVNEVLTETEAAGLKFSPHFNSPNLPFTGVATFSFVARDITGDSRTAEYSINVAAPAFSDSDDDGVSDEIDLDDDNDGIYDDVECPQINTSEFNGTFGKINTEKTRNLTKSPGNTYSYGGSNVNSLLPEGRYVITSRTWCNSIHTGIWKNLNGHTVGDKTDAYLAVNGSITPGVFYREDLQLKPNTYKLAVWAISAFVGSSTEPGNIEIRLYDGNTIVASFQTGNLYPTIKLSGSEITRSDWRQATGFVTIQKAGTYRLEVSNLSLALDGNDFAIDDISVKPLNCPDTDGDGIADSKDIDSDNDGCADANEYYNSSHAAGVDNRYGDEDRTVDVNGKVDGAAYSGSYVNVTSSGRFAITKQPKKQVVDIGDQASFSAEPEHPLATDTYQWQASTDGGKTWVNLTNNKTYSGVNTLKLILTGINIALNKHQYRIFVAKADNICGNHSEAALLDIKPLAKNDEDCFTAGNSSTIDVLANDHDGDKPIASTVFFVSPAAIEEGKKLVVKSQGSWGISSGGKIIFTPEPNYAEDPSPVAYKVRDAEGNNSNEAKLTLKVVKVPDVTLKGSQAKQF